jgi:hypothetical protein
MSAAISGTVRVAIPDIAALIRLQTAQDVSSELAVQSA